MDEINGIAMPNTEPSRVKDVILIVSAVLSGVLLGCFLASNGEYSLTWEFPFRDGMKAFDIYLSACVFLLPLTVQCAVLFLSGFSHLAGVAVFSTVTFRCAALAFSLSVMPNGDRHSAVFSVSYAAATAAICIFSFMTLKFQHELFMADSEKKGLVPRHLYSFCSVTGGAFLASLLPVMITYFVK